MGSCHNSEISCNDHDTTRITIARNCGKKRQCLTVQINFKCSAKQKQLPKIEENQKKFIRDSSNHQNNKQHAINKFVYWCEP